MSAYKEWSVALRKPDGTCRYWQHTNKEAARRHAVALVARYAVDVTVHGRHFVVDAIAYLESDTCKRSIREMHRKDATRLVARFNETLRSMDNDQSNTE